MLKKESAVLHHARDHKKLKSENKRCHSKSKRQTFILCTLQLHHTRICEHMNAMITQRGTRLTQNKVRKAAPEFHDLKNCDPSAWKQKPSRHLSATNIEYNASAGECAHMLQMTFQICDCGFIFRFLPPPCKQSLVFVLLHRAMQRAKKIRTAKPNLIKTISNLFRTTSCTYQARRTQNQASIYVSTTVLKNFNSGTDSQLFWFTSHFLSNLRRHYSAKPQVNLRAIILTLATICSKLLFLLRFETSWTAKFE